MAKRIILHIGQQKTGTSALQTFFEKNRGLFASDGIGYYQPLYRYNLWDGPSNADFLCSAALRDLGDKAGEDAAARLRDELPSFNAYCQSFDTVLLSEEMMWHYGVYREGFWEALRNCLTKLCDPEARISIILYLRRQDEWILSQWKEVLRAEYAEKRSFPDFLADAEEEGVLDYAARVRDIKKVFGREALVVRSYHSDRFRKADIYRDFLEAAQLPRYEEASLPSKQVNPSLTMTAAAALLLINQGRVPCSGTRFGIYLAADNFSRFCRETIRAYPLDTDVHRALLRRCVEGNRRIAERYGLGDTLFPEELGDWVPWEPDEKRDLENARTIAKTAALPRSDLFRIRERIEKTSVSDGSAGK